MYSPFGLSALTMAIGVAQVIWAYIFATAEHIKNGATDIELQPFRQGMLSCPMRFMKVDNEMERYWKHHQSREDAQQLGDSIRRSSIERAFDVMEAKAMLNLPSTGAAACAAAWRDNVKLARGSEPIKTGYVDAVFTVWSRIMDHADSRELVLKFETELAQSPWDSIYKLEAIVKRCSTHGYIVWALSSLFDAIKTGLVTAPELAVRQLEGTHSAWLV